MNNSKNINFEDETHHSEIVVLDAQNTFRNLNECHQNETAAN